MTVKDTSRALLLTTILDFANATKYSRCYEEADRLLQAGHLFLCGKTTSSEDKVSIFALWLATSNVKGDPMRSMWSLLQEVTAASSVSKGQSARAWQARRNAASTQWALFYIATGMYLQTNLCHAARVQDGLEALMIVAR